MFSAANFFCGNWSAGKTLNKHNPMALIKSVTVGDRIIDLYNFHGEVVDEKKWATTQVSGGGSTTQATGYASNAPITSATTTHDQFFVRSDDGQEMAVETANAGLALRKGHRVTVFWGIIKGNESGPYVAIDNHTTGNLTKIDSAIYNLAVPGASMGFLMGIIVGVFAICFYGLGIIVLAFLLIQRSKRKQQLLGTLRPVIDEAIAECRKQK
jgi:hypothetical protein